MEPYFTIIIPTYNRAHMLPKAIESVIDQTFSDWELIIVDDGSTDNTKELVLGYGDNRIKYIYQENKERSAARNNGIRNAIGKYICFLDSDDYYLYERLTLIHNFIVGKNESIALFFTSICFENKGIINEREQLEILNSSNIYDYIVQAIIGVPQVCIHNLILKQSFFNPLFRIGEDMELWLRIARDYPLIFVPNQATIVAVIHDERSVNEKKFNSFSEMLLMLKSIFQKDHSGRQISEIVKKNVLSNCYFGISRYCIYQNLRKRAIINLVKSIFTKINHKQTKYKINLISKLINPILSINKTIELLEN